MHTARPGKKADKEASFKKLSESNEHLKNLHAKNLFK